MGRFAILAIALAVVVGGCAGARVRSADPSVSIPTAAGDDLRLFADDGTTDGGAVAPGQPTASIDASPAQIEAPPPPGVDARQLGRFCDACGGATCEGGQCHGGRRCCPTYPCGNPCGGYGGLSVNVLPGFGAGIEMGVNFHTTKRAMWSVELGIQYQDLTESISGETGAGKMYQMRAGVRGRFKPCCRGHPTVRGGLTWFNLTGNPAGLDTASVDSEGDYLGAYVGVGYEWDIGRNWSTGPEAAVSLGVNTNNGDFGVVPTIFWHFNYQF